MKIAIISPHFFPYVEFGGPVSSLWGLSKKLSKFYSINIFTIYNGKNIFFKNRDINESEIFKNVKCSYYKEQIKDFFSFDFLINILKNIKKNDLIFIQYVFNYTSIISLLVSIFLKKKIIVSPRGSISKYGIHSKRTFLKKLWLIMFFYPFQKKILWHATSFNERNDIMDFFPNSKIKIMFDGVDNSFLNRDSIKQRKIILDMFSINDRNINKVFCSLGRLHKVKRYDLLIDSFKKYSKNNKSSVLIIGGSDFGEKDYLLRKIKNSNKIFLVGHLNEVQKVKLLKNSDFFILTSDYESFSISTIEALSLGTPVIISNNLPWKDVFEKKCGMLVENNVFSILDALEKSKFCLFSSTSCKNYVKLKFTWESITKCFIKKFIEEI